MEFTHYSKFPLDKVEGAVKGISERLVSGERDSDSLVRILEFAPGTDTTPNGVQEHDYWEEVFVIEGSFYDISLKKEFSTGMVATRPPGMKHGPWKTENGVIMYEVRHVK